MRKQILCPRIIRHCNESADLHMCQHHLECSEKDPYEIIEGSEIRPCEAPVSHSKKIKLVNALMSISPKKFMEGKKLKRYNRNLAKTLLSNPANVEVVELQVHRDASNNDFYSEVMLDGHRSSENFRSFKPIVNKTQVVIDKGSCQMIGNLWKVSG